MPGKPLKYTPERVQRFLNAIRAGNTRQAACRYAGISDETLANWQRRHLEFLEGLTRAEAESEVALVALVRTVAQQDWRAAMTLLERRFPDDWGKRERVDLEVYIRQRAHDLGIDEQEAFDAIKPQLRLTG